MALQFICGQEDRRDKVRALDGQGGAALLHGIDFLEVLDGGPPDVPAKYRQRLLLIRCFHPVDGLGLGPGNAILSGGVRVQGIRVRGLRVLSELANAPSGVFGPLAAALIELRDQRDADSTDDARNWLVVLVNARGDFSTYTFALVDDASELDPSAPAGFDPILRSVAFSFKAECPSDFDCEVGSDPLPERPVTPNIDYLAKDYASFRQLMLDRLSVTMGDWDERSPADLGVALVEVIAYAADHLSYFQDAVGTEAYLATARTRPSVRRHARLLDYAVHEGCNARAWVQLQVGRGQVQQTDPATGAPLVARGTPILARIPSLGRRAVLSRLEAEELASSQRLQFETMHDVHLLAGSHNRIRFYTWGNSRCVLRAGATGASLLDSTAPGEVLHIEVGDVLILEEERGPDTGVPGDADPTHRHAVRVIRATRRMDPAYDLAVLDVEWSDGDALPFELPLHDVDIEHQAPDGTLTVRTEPASVARGNIVLVDHGRMLEQPHAVGPIDRPLHFQAYVPEAELTFAEPYDHWQAGVAAASSVLIQDPRRAVPHVLLIDRSGDAWTPLRDLLGAGPNALAFVVEMEEDRRGQIRFGDDVDGAHPAAGEVFHARYRVGNGSDGHVGIGALTHLVHDTLGGFVAAVTNPLPAVGGRDPEPLEQVRLHAPAAFRTQERAVSEADWAEVTERHPDVQRAVATIRWTGSWHTIFVTVDRFGGKEVDAAFIDQMLAYLEPYRLVGYDLEIDPPVMVPLDIAFTVCVAPGHFQSHVKEALHKRFGTGLRRDGRRGFFHPDHFTFGQSVYLSRVVAAAMEVPGVAWVDTQPGHTTSQHRFHRLHEVPLDELQQGVIAMGRLEIARCDLDPNQPDNGRIQFYMRGGM